MPVPEIRTYFTTFGSVSRVYLIESGKVAKVIFSDPSLVDDMVTMAKRGSLTMGEEDVLRIEYGERIEDYERRMGGRGDLPTKHNAMTLRWRGDQERGRAPAAPGGGCGGRRRHRNGKAEKKKL